MKKPGIYINHLFEIYKVIVKCMKIKCEARIFEYGCGHSTVFLTTFIHAASPKFTWRCVETDPVWRTNVFEEFRQMNPYDVPNDIKIKIIDYKTHEQDALKKLCMKEYVEAIHQEKQWDIVLIDGRKRVRCIAEARKTLNDGGCIILHDAERPYYHDACVDMKIDKHYGPRGEQMWVMWP